MNGMVSCLVRRQKIVKICLAKRFSEKKTYGGVESLFILYEKNESSVLSCKKYNSRHESSASMIHSASPQ